jgi:hypothetical protein
MADINSSEEYCLLGYAVIQSDSSLSKFQRNILPPSSGTKSKPSMEKVVRARIGALSKRTFKGFNYFIVLLVQDSNASLHPYHFFHVWPNHQH